MVALGEVDPELAQASSVASSSTPSPIVRIPRLSAIVTIDCTIARSAAESVIPRTNSMSIFR